MITLGNKKGVFKVKSNKREFIQKAQQIHGKKYDYSIVDYVCSRKKVKIKCPTHKIIFEQTPNSHLNGRGCKKCGLKRMSEELSWSKTELLIEFKKIHKNKYDYSLIKYKDCHTKIKIICNKHGIFNQTATKHLYGQGCPKCARELETYNQMTTEEFIKKAQRIHGNKYDYSLVDYKKSRFKIKIICPKHGIFEQIPNNHLRGMECANCGQEKVQKFAESRKLTIHEFISKAQKIHGMKYNYSKVNYKGGSNKVIIICPTHGEFLQEPSAHLNKRGCPLCQESRGERMIALFLKNHNIHYERQKTFKKCKNKRQLAFDFYVSDHNLCIEYDGKQHSQPCDFFGGISAFEQLKKLDSIKNEFCSNNEIKLIRISYKLPNKEIGSILEKELLNSL